MAVIVCPFCRRYISSTLTHCPECGKELSDHLPPSQVEQAESVAPNTQTEPAEPVIVVKKSKNPFRKRYSSEQAQSGRESGNGHEQALAESYKPLWRRVSFRRIVLALFLLLVIAGVTAFLVIDHQRTVALEQRAYDRLVGCTRLECFEDFLVRFPDGEHIEQVKQMYEQVQSERAVYLSETAGGTKDELLRFIKSRPKSPYCRVCEIRIDSLDWDEATRINTVSSYTQYLADHPSGLFAEAASESKNRQAKLEISDEERSKLSGVLDAFLSALAAGDAPRIDQLLGDETISFCGTPNSTGANILALYQQHFNHSDILGVHFSVLGDFNIKKRPSVSHTGRYDYSVAAKLEATINRTATDSSHVQRWALAAQLTPERRFTVIDMRKE